MSETTVMIAGHKCWTPEQMDKDLSKTGLLEDFFYIIHKYPESWTDYTGLCGGGNPMKITWVADKLLVVCMKTVHQRMINAFAAVVEYKPFCQYQTVFEGEIWSVTEWFKGEVPERIEEIKKDPKIRDFRLLD